MRKILPFVFALLAFLFLALAGAHPAAAQIRDHREIKTPPLRSFTIAEPLRTTLKNGMVILLMEDHELPVIQAYALVRTGSRRVPADKAGLASIFGEVLRTGGAGKKTGDEIDDFLEAQGATIETDIYENYGIGVLWCLKEDFGEIFRLFADILRNPSFAEDKIGVVRNQAMAGVARRNDDPLDIMFREHAKLVYGADSPYAQVPEFATVMSITREDLLGFHRKYFHPNRMVVALVGDFDAKKMRKILKEVFGSWPKGKREEETEVKIQESVKPGVYYVPKEDMNQSNIIMGHLGIEKHNPDRFAVDILNEVLGGSFASRLFSNVRSRKGLAYAVAGSIGAEYDFPGMFNVWMTTKTETTAAGLDALLEEIEKIVKEPPSPEEVERAKDTILNSFIFNYDSRGKTLRQQLVYEFFAFPKDSLARYRKEIEKVSVEEVARVANKYIHRDQLAILVVGPSQGYDRPLESFGPITQVDITIPPPPQETP